MCEISFHGFDITIRFSFVSESLPDALANGCSKCSEKQKAGSEKVIRYLINQRPKLWEKLSKKYDPTGEFQKKFKNEAEKHGIKL
ncbi:hypothetical protein M0804_007795 [Polistes exclamans]|nr:hypothetical protein M0804_007795 [Polistes exclamans]